MNLHKGVIILITLAAVSAASAEDQAVDPLTKLPLPAAGSTFSLDAKPMPLDEPVCKSKGKMNLYGALGGKVSAAISWYKAHLRGFKYVHGSGTGRSQDTFYNSSGTSMVSITGSSGKADEDTNVLNVIYGSIAPGVDGNVIKSITDNRGCPP